MPKKTEFEICIIQQQGRSSGRDMGEGEKQYGELDHCYMAV